MSGVVSLTLFLTGDHNPHQNSLFSRYQLLLLIIAHITYVVLIGMHGEVVSYE